MEEENISPGVQLLQAPQASGQSPWGYLHNLPFLVLIPWLLSPHGSFVGLLTGSPIARLHPQAFKSCSCPALRPKIGPRGSDRDVCALIDGEPNMSEARSWGETPSYVAENSQDVTAIFATWEKRRLLFIGGADIKLTHPSVSREACSWAPAS